jgi:hypothetical protein
MRNPLRHKPLCWRNINTHNPEFRRFKSTENTNGAPRRVNQEARLPLSRLMCRQPAIPSMRKKWESHGLISQIGAVHDK